MHSAFFYALALFYIILECIEAIEMTKITEKKVFYWILVGFWIIIPLVFIYLAIVMDSMLDVENEPQLGWIANFYKGFAIILSANIALLFINQFAKASQFHKPFVFTSMLSGLGALVDIYLKTEYLGETPYSNPALVFLFLHVLVLYFTQRNFGERKGKRINP